MRPVALPALAASLLALSLAACKPAEKAPEAAATTAAAAPVAPIATVSAEEGAKVAHARHEGFESMGKAMKAMSDTLKSGNPDIAVIRASAAKINEMAPKVATWFPAGSGPDVAPKSEALPAIWEKPAEFQQAAARLVDEAGKFDKLVNEKGVAEAGAGMKALDGACKGCHEQFRKEDD